MSDTGPSDKEGKIMDSSEVKEEESSSSSSHHQWLMLIQRPPTKCHWRFLKKKVPIHHQRSKNMIRALAMQTQNRIMVGTQLEQLRAALANRADEELPEPPGDIFLFETEINNSNRLLIPTGRAKRHFPRFYRGGSNKPKILHLIIPQVKEWHMPVMHCSDEDAFMFTRLWPQFVKFHNLKPLDKIRFYKPNKDWYMDVIRYSPDFYMIIEEWDEFVRERNLKAKDVIKFYRPVQPSHRKHFLIEIVKKDGVTDPTQPGSTQSEGDGNKHGDHGGPSHGGSYKGKEINID
ncbi:hypothetical protein Acr_13g0007940 [Actinidia rufa]|uniref:AP2/B3-like transcriptional factor family protein n=1 Tax=Actinidia rufa TaxID=165716 RepID=A0A7J0FLC6_9ERIC|nr:hypothetical protein Acr_13g0007940 [Actinidia rufa]